MFPQTRKMQFWQSFQKNFSQKVKLIKKIIFFFQNVPLDM